MTKTKPVTKDARWDQPLEVGLPASQWRALREVAVKASENPDPRYAFARPFLRKLDAALADAPRASGNPNVTVTGSVYGWSLLAGAILEFGSEEARTAGRVIVCGASQVIHGRAKDAEA